MTVRIHTTRRLDFEMYVVREGLCILSLGSAMLIDCSMQLFTRFNGPKLEAKVTALLEHHEMVDILDDSAEVAALETFHSSCSMSSAVGLVSREFSCHMCCLESPSKCPGMSILVSRIRPRSWLMVQLRLPRNFSY